MPRPVRTLCYDELVVEYERRLEEVLRGFDAGVEGLESWVPDADALASVEGLLEALVHAGDTGVVLHLERGVFASRQIAEWEELGARFGSIRVDATSAPIRLEFTFHAVDKGAAKRVRPVPVRAAPRVREQQPAGAVSRLPDAYRQRVMTAASGASRQEDEIAACGLLTVLARHEGWQLAAVIDDQHVVTKARHSGAVGDDERGVLELLCQVGEGTPVLEWADHGVLAVMQLARDPESESPVAGVPQPENTALLFARANALVRRLLAEYRLATGYAEIDNRVEVGASRSWLELSDAARLGRVRREFAAACAAAGFGSGEAELVELRGISRVVVRLGDDVKPSTRRGLLFRLERELTARVEPCLTVERLARRDLNVIRRL